MVTKAENQAMNLSIIIHLKNIFIRHYHTKSILEKGAPQEKLNF